MKFNNKFKINNEFNDIFSFENEKDELNHEAKLLTIRFLEEIENHIEKSNKKFRKKDLADALKMSQSFISQLYSGDKLMNFIHLAKIQKEFKINFNIKAVNETFNYDIKTVEVNLTGKFKNNKNDGVWIWKSNSPDYTKKTNYKENKKDNLTAA